MKITCPQCGADIEIQPRSLQLICPFCNTQLIFDKELALESYRLKPTCEEEPTRHILKQFLTEKNRIEEIEECQLSYLPFYRFLYEKNNKIVEKIFSALEKPPFPFLSIPSGSMAPMGKDEKILIVKPECNLSSILEKMRRKEAKSLEEMLLIYYPFWRIKISSGETIWLDAVQGKIVSGENLKEQKDMKKFFKTILIGFFILLLIEGIVVPSHILRILLQGATAIGFFYFARKRLNNEY